MSIRVAYCTGFWCTNIGNAFFGLGVEYVLKKILGDENVTVVSDYQTYTTEYGRRLYPHHNQLDYISKLDVDYVVLAGPVLSKYFLSLWKNILVRLEQRGIRYMLLSAGIMKMPETSLKECREFFDEHPPYVLISRDRITYDTFGKYADHAYDGICFSFFTPDYYSPSPIKEKYITLNFDKIPEPTIKVVDITHEHTFEFDGVYYHVERSGFISKLTAKTDRFSDALTYATSMLPQKRRPDKIGSYTIFRTDHRFHPHYRRKIYNQNNSFCADLPYGYLNIYAGSELTLSDRVHACAVTMAYGHSAMLFSKTNRVGLLERVGANDISEHPVFLDMEYVKKEKKNMVEWLEKMLK